jgi:magnesium chelatase subunit D
MMSLPDLNNAFVGAALALDLLGIDPLLGGIHLSARHGPVCARFLDLVSAQKQRVQRLHPAVSDDALFGGIDVVSTLSTGHRVYSQGVLDSPATIVLQMAERSTKGLAARLGSCLDCAEGHIVIAVDESTENDPSVPGALAERLAFHFNLSVTALGDIPQLEHAEIASARARLATTNMPTHFIEQIASLTLAFGVESQRAGLFALRAARAHAALRSREVCTEDMEIAAALILAHRATQVPEAPRDAQPDPPPPRDEGSQDQGDSSAGDQFPEELLVEAVKAYLPPSLLSSQSNSPSRLNGTGEGAVHKGGMRGRPLPSSKIKRTRDARLDLLATLRAATPMQKLRDRSGVRTGIKIRAEDFRFRQFEEKASRLLIFAVDASGSSAFNRLAEAKGAIEYMLSQAYANRDHVCLIAFRDREARLLLPSTRSMVMTKRRLAQLPGGGGTPLAAGLALAAAEGYSARRSGMQPFICVLTDGRANIALDGSPDRQKAHDDAMQIARKLKDTDALVIDCGTRPSDALRDLSKAADCRYISLPRAGAAQLAGHLTDIMRS